MRGAIRFFLEVRTPYRVCGDVGDATSAIEKAREFNCDLVLLDLSTTTLIDVETATILRAILPKAKIVGFSMAGEEFGTQTLAPATFDVVLSKHDGLAKLWATVRSLLPTPAEGKPADAPPE